ncbi:hypothetical protein E3O55_05170 [Cryobacterium sp. MDB1-18-2]|uniref:hypothetical protein n=1 Tax=unclassified Cryobacterium TaxID=2649013 RepID=UPI00106BEA75|nr:MULTISPECIES: hypothetical protein [unclassified Cryobacterium]TFC32902.1 hypothetical protein E3O55_05170 [Cryobacterium sp. MDB1-18-2]TFC44645.1 hypothetical protein E3O50_05265 [Cryobacterium sp. MDB1-18-1]
MNDIHDAEAISNSVAERASAILSRKAPKTDEQLLAEAEKRTGLLRKKVIANRDRQRMQLVSDLYLKYSIEAVADDMSESKRISALRDKLAL